MPKHEEFFICFWILVFSMSKKIGQALGKESHTFVLGKSQTARHKILVGIKHEWPMCHSLLKNFLKNYPSH
jgi:hypothetical protein